MIKTNKTNPYVKTVFRLNLSAIIPRGKDGECINQVIKNIQANHIGKGAGGVRQDSLFEKLTTKWLNVNSPE